MSFTEIKLNKDQFKLFNDDDQFQLFCDNKGFPYFDEEVDKLFKKFDYICIEDDDCVYGVKNKNREMLSNYTYEGN